MALYGNYEHIYGLVGFPLGHSFSQNFFNQKFQNEKIDARYINFEISDVKKIGEIIADCPNLKGFNVTIPYKVQIMDLLDAVDPVAMAIGAVNVVKVKRRSDGSAFLTGYNSDTLGFAESLAPMLKGGNYTHALVLGTGGASRAVCHALRSLGIEPRLVSRHASEGVLTYDDLTPQLLDRYRVIVNTTPLGMHPNVDRCPPIPYSALTPQHICYDLVYNPECTLFMKQAAMHGARVKNGLEMLKLQAMGAWNIWQQ